MAVRFHVIWDRTLLGAGEDVAVNTFHFDGAATEAFHDAFVARFATAWPTLQSFISNKYKVSRIKSYQEGPAPNFPVKDSAVSHLGSATTSPLPPQVAVTVTEKTFTPTEWGRIYIPGFSAARSNTVGRLTLDDVAIVANWAQALWADFTVAPVHVPIVYQRSTAEEHQVLSVQVDDLFDVQRRRRYSAPLVRDVRVL